MKISQVHGTQKGEGRAVGFNQGIQKGSRKGILKEDPKGTLQTGSRYDIQNRVQKGGARLEKFVFHKIITFDC